MVVREERGRKREVSEMSRRLRGNTRGGRERERVHVCVCVHELINRDVPRGGDGILTGNVFYP